MKHFAKTAAITMLCSLALVVATGAAQAKTKLVPKVDSFLVLVDHSGSMLQNNEVTETAKIEMAKDIASRMGKMVPDLGYNYAVRTFAPNAQKVDVSPWNPGQFDSAVNGLETNYSIFGRRTPMGEGILSADSTVGALPARTGVIIISDGESNMGMDAVAAAQGLYDKYNRDLCIHTVNVGTSASGKMVMDRIAELRSCGVKVNYEDLSSEMGMKQFVKDVFYDEVIVEEAKPAPKPAPAPAPEIEEVISFRSVNFDFDSSAIKPEMEPILDEAAMILMDMNKPVVLEGHTCNIGAEAYNQGLSERRAASVMKYLEAKGVSAMKMETIGFGESNPVADNNTEEGRRLNRRVDIRMK